MKNVILRQIFRKDDPMIIYLCSPNNPTGTALNKSNLTMWVKYAKQTGAVIFFDLAYEAFITEPNIPHSIYEIEGAKDVAIEFRSYSETAGLTGLRHGYCVVPKELMLETKKDDKVSANELWKCHQRAKFKGCSYIVQRGAEASYTEEGKKQIQVTLAVYREMQRSSWMPVKNPVSMHMAVSTARISGRLFRKE